MSTRCRNGYTAPIPQRGGFVTVVALVGARNAPNGRVRDTTYSIDGSTPRGYEIRLLSSYFERSCGRCGDDNDSNTRTTTTDRWRINYFPTIRR